VSALDRRLTALEAIAEQARRRAARDLILHLPEARDLTPAELEEAIDEALRLLDRTAGWRREGLSECGIMQRYANESGVPVEDVIRERDAIVAERGR